MAARLLTALVGIPVFLGLLYLGGWAWTGLVVLLTVLGSWEMGVLLRQVSPKGTTPSPLLLTLGGVIFVLLAYGSDKTPPLYWNAVLIGILLVAFIREIARHDRAPIHGVGGALLGAIYPGALFAHLVLLRGMPHGFEWVLFVTLGTWASDSAAFFVGSAMGRHLLAPTISPKKTWEGSVGGLVGAAVMGLAFGLFTPITPALGVIGGLVISAVGQLGDLAASSLKRQAQLKDTGTLLPGHGGVLDRFDSLLFAGAVVYYGLLFTGGWPAG